MNELWMVRLEINSSRLFELARRRSLPLRETDAGYLVHCLFGEAFGELAPRPFRIQESRGARTVVLAYNERGHEDLASAAATYADPSIHSAVDWAAAASKRMPSEWREGQQFGFEVRVCPVVRMAREGPHHRKGAEVDAFLAACWKAGPEVPVNREAIYRQWLADRLEGKGARLLACELKGFKRERLVRRNHDEPRRASVRERPDALLCGRLVVTNPGSFQRMLRVGIGRHRSFGFGMLLLRPC